MAPTNSDVTFQHSLEHSHDNISLNQKKAETMLKHTFAHIRRSPSAMCAVLL